MKADDLQRDRFARAFAVSRETMARLDAYHQLLTKWQRAINLVGDSTLDAFWTRHVWDSAQLASLLPVTRHDQEASVTDLGSGGGFPGLVIALLTDRPVTLVEADSRKCAFLSTVGRELGLRYRLCPQRVEQLRAVPFATVTARAFAPLPRLLRWSAHLIQPETEFWLLKGARWHQELDEAQQSFTFQTTAHPSQTEPEARILHLTQVKQKD